MLRIAVLVSGNGTNLQTVIDGIESRSIPDAEIGLVISSNPNAYSLERAKKHNIRSMVIGKANYPDVEDRTKALINALVEAKTDLVILAGYMNILDSKMIETYRGRIINIHPSLIPQFCGHGFYGKHVHEAVLASGTLETGATVHYVDEGIDTGPIILQEKVPVLQGDTADTLATRVLKTEHKILSEALKKVIASIKKGDR